MKLAIGCDHAGYALKEAIKAYFNEIEFMDKGTFSADSVDYPDYAHAVAKAIQEGEATMGILLCGSANGVSITANKHSGVRAAIAWNPEVASLARQHNDANILSLPARYLSESETMKIIEVFLGSTFEGGRHAHRVSKIENLSKSIV